MAGVAYPMCVAHDGTGAPMTDGKALARALRVYSCTTRVVSSRPYRSGDRTAWYVTGNMRMHLCASCAASGV